MEIEEKSPTTAPEEGKSLNNGEKKEDSSNSETWSSSVKDSKWATAEPTENENPYERSNGSSSQSRWAAPEGNRYRSQHNEKGFGGYGHTDRNRREHSNYSRPYNNQQGYGGSTDGSAESFRPGNNPSFGNRSNNDMDNKRFTGTTGMRFDSNTNQNYQNRPHNSTFREPDNSFRSNNRYDNRSHTSRNYDSNNHNRNDRSFGQQHHQHEGFERQYNRSNYQNDRNNQHQGRQNQNDAISKWHTGILVEEEPRSSAHERPWNMRFVTGDQQQKAPKSDDGNERNDGYEEKKSAEDKVEAATLAGNTQPKQKLDKPDEKYENVVNGNHDKKAIQNDTANIQQTSQEIIEKAETAVIGATEAVNAQSSLGSIHAAPQGAVHDNSQSDVNQPDEHAIRDAESVKTDSTASNHSANPKQAVETKEHVDGRQKHATENSGAAGFSSDSIHAHQERRQQRPTERRQSGPNASAGKTPSIVNRLAAGGYHKPTVDEDALNAKIERIRLQNEKIERKQKLIEQEELEIAQHMKLENEKLEKERLENDKFERESRLAEEQKQREKQEKEQRILEQIRAERDANASRKAEAMSNRDWDMSKGENDDGYRDRHSRSRFSNDISKRWPSPPPRSRNEHGFDHGSGQHSQGYRRHDAHHTHREPVKKQFSVTEELWPDLGNVKGETAGAERKPVVWAARAALQAKGQNVTPDKEKSSSPPSNSQSTGDPRKLVSWPSKKVQDFTEATSPKHDENDAKPTPPKLNWEDLIAKTTPVKDWASESPANDDMDFGSSPFG